VAADLSTTASALRRVLCGTAARLLDEEEATEMGRDDQDDAFRAWLDQMSYLSGWELRELPAWQRPLALIHDFALDSLGDGAGSLFYNNPDSIDGVDSALAELGEHELAEKIRAIKGMVEAANPSDVVEYVMGPAIQHVEELDTLLSRCWDTLYAKIEERARANGWKP
jgi:hypothetical protein